MGYEWPTRGRRGISNHWNPWTATSNLVLAGPYRTFTMVPCIVFNRLLTKETKPLKMPLTDIEYLIDIKKVTSLHILHKFWRDSCIHRHCIMFMLYLFSIWDIFSDVLIEKLSCFSRGHFSE